MPGGPQPLSHEQRIALAKDITERILAVHGEYVLAIGIYGSTARGTDGPYSDVEMLCVLRTSGEDYTYEWTPGPWKAEVNFRSQDVELREAAKVEDDWPLTHGRYCDALPTYDPDGFFAELCSSITLQSAEAFEVSMREVMVGDMYELLGKLRNATSLSHPADIPRLAVELVWKGALLLGLAHRFTYFTSSTMLEQSLHLPSRPAGYDKLCALVMGGYLADGFAVADACEAFWNGVEQWAAERMLILEEPRRIPF